MVDIISNRNCVYQTAYHVIWCPKYRRKVLAGNIKDRFLELISEKANELQVEIIEANIQPDHVHLFVRTQPIHSPQFVVGQLKGYSSRILRKEFSTLRTRIPTLWTRSYYVDSVGKLNEHAIRKYIQEQDKN